MEQEYAVVANDVSKVYRLYKNQNERIFDLLLGKKNLREFYALQGVSFEVRRGESVGLIGINGSGKSTLANLIGGVTEPTMGEISVAGEPALISIGAGLSPQLTGLENIEFKGLMMGLSKKQILQIRDDIIAFSGIDKFIDQPVKTYSSGMKARLGFSIAVNINPDIMIVDEALSVGDPTFSERCLERMNEFRKRGKTIFFVSHSLAQVEAFCSRVIWLDHGIQKANGATEEVLPMYRRFLSEYNSKKS